MSLALSISRHRLLASSLILRSVFPLNRHKLHYNSAATRTSSITTGYITHASVRSSLLFRRCAISCHFSTNVDRSHPRNNHAARASLKPKPSKTDYRISGRIMIMFGKEFCEDRNIAGVEKLILDEWKEMSMRNIGMLLHRCSKAEIVLSSASLDRICDAIQRSTDAMGAQGVGNALYGLNLMKSDGPQMQRLLRVLTEKMKSCDDRLKEQAVGNALYGLQKMSSDAVEVKELLRVLTKMISSCDERLQHRESETRCWDCRR